MEGHLTDGLVEVGANARERYYDSRGYGRPRGDGLALSRVEAAHLLYRGDLAAVDGQGFRAFLAANEDILTRFLVYADLRDRGFYLSPAREGWVDTPAGADFIVYERGEGPWSDAIAHRVRVRGEREDVALDTLGDVVLAVVDEESEITYLSTSRIAPTGSNQATVDGPVAGHLLADRVLCWEPPPALYEREFYGQWLGRDDAVLQLSLVEAAALAARGVLEVDGGLAAVADSGRGVEGERFDRRLRVYRALRDRGIVPKTGFKFGADFRTYADVDSVDDLGHSELLVRVLSRGSVRSPRELSLDVRLAHGVRKRMVYALVAADGDGNGGEDGGGKSDDGIRWVAIERLTP